MGKSRILCALILVVAMLLTLFGCKKDEVEKLQEPIAVGIYEPPSTFDIAATRSLVSETIGRAIFSTLFAFNDELEVVPQLAKGYEQISDTEWVIEIYGNAKFHDGGELVASDVVYSIKRAMGSERRDVSLDVIAEVEALDTTRIKFTTVLPKTNLLSTLVRVSTSIMSEKAMSNPKYDIEKPIGSGPYKIIENKNGELIRVERFDDYFLEGAKNKYINFVVDVSDASLVASLLNGTIDLIFRVSPHDAVTLKLNDDVVVHETRSSKMELLLLNSEYEPLGNANVRKAISSAIDKQKLIDNMLQGYGYRLNSILPHAILGSIDSEEFEYNPELAKQLLKEEGYEDGFEVSLTTYNPLKKQQMEYIKLDLSQVGITLNYEVHEIKNMLDIISKGENQISILAWTCNADPDSVFSQIFIEDSSYSINHNRYTNERVEELVTEGRYETNVEKRREIYQEANSIIVESASAIPLYEPVLLVASAKDIGGVRINPQGLYSFESLFRIEE